jgi:predicted small lipoprotein YifL
MLKIKKIGAGIALASMLNLAGCGQAGPLYLPAKTSAHDSGSLMQAFVAATLQQTNS